MKNILIIIQVLISDGFKFFKTILKNIELDINNPHILVGLTTLVLTPIFYFGLSYFGITSIITAAIIIGVVTIVGALFLFDLDMWIVAIIFNAYSILLFYNLHSTIINAKPNVHIVQRTIEYDGVRDKIDKKKLNSCQNQMFTVEHAKNKLFWVSEDILFFDCDSEKIEPQNVQKI